MPLTQRKIRRLSRTVLKGERIDRAEISIAVVADKRMADLAQRYARRRYRTDVFAFDLSDHKGELTAQVIVNAQLARDRARQFHIDPGSELALYIVHGLLHLCGYDDHRSQDARRMHRRTKKYLLEAGFKNPPPLPEPGE